MSKEEKEVDTKKVLTFNLDPNQFNAAVIFADGMMARMIKSPIRIPSTNEWLFFLYPTESLKAKYNLDEERRIDPDYKAEEDLYEKRFSSYDCCILDPDPLFQRWFIFSNWDGEVYNPFANISRENEIKLRSIAKERDNLDQLVKRKDIMIERLTESDFRVLEKIGEKWAKGVKESASAILPPNLKGVQQ